MKTTNKKRNVANNTPLYVILDEDIYNQCAADVVELSKHIEKFNNKLDSLKNEIKVSGSRINLYMKEFYKRYKYIDHSLLFINHNKVELYYAKDMRNAIELQKEKNDDVIFDEEYDAIFGEDEYAIDHNNILNNLQQYLPNPLCTITLKNDQTSLLHKLLSRHDTVVRKIEFINEKLSELHQEYQEILDDCVQNLEDDESYNFNSDIHSLILVHIQDDAKWHLLYCLDENTDNVKTMLM